MTLVHLELVLRSFAARLFAHAPAEIVELVVTEPAMPIAASATISKCAEIVLNLVNCLLDLATKLEELVAYALAKAVGPVLVAPGAEDGHFKGNCGTDARSCGGRDDEGMHHGEVVQTLDNVPVLRCVKVRCGPNDDVKLALVEIVCEMSVAEK